MGHIPWKFPRQEFCGLGPWCKAALPPAIQLLCQKKRFGTWLHHSLSPEVHSFLEFIVLQIGEDKYNLQSPCYHGWNLIFNIVNQSKWHLDFMRVPFKIERMFASRCYNIVWFTLWGKHSYLSIYETSLLFRHPSQSISLSLPLLSWQGLIPLEGCCTDTVCLFDIKQLLYTSVIFLFWGLKQYDQCHSLRFFWSMLCSTRCCFVFSVFLFLEWILRVIGASRTRSDCPLYVTLVRPPAEGSEVVYL